MFCLNAIGDRCANQQMNNLVGEMIVAHQSEWIIRRGRQFKKLLVSAEHQKQSVNIPDGN
ncbi:hypothetical protein SAMN02745911_0749 [Aureimonas altamirensis DSM 21988]|uniref:Transposase, Mutator family n=1 Tax=Aureimonas altamirensis DSM 21988 TaxID=1121026 RepID=A0ABY1I5W9_9HYPH|nr:hypothetical protein SAMN02745911_0749 [Aureimonas altamirensis DSM 21988]